MDRRTAFLSQDLKVWARKRLPDRYERALHYYDAYGRLPRVNGAQTWSEKLNVRVLYDRRPVIAMMADKLAAREYAASAAPTLRAPALAWSGTDVAELAALSLPDDWVLKPNHRSGNVYFGHGPVRDVAALQQATEGWLEEFHYCREWSYSQARRLLLVEERLGGCDRPPDDYKFFAFDGVVMFLQHHAGRFSDHASRHYTPDWQPLPVKTVLPLTPVRPPPTALGEMVAAAEALSKGIDFVRVDLYEHLGAAYFGELTAYPGSGLAPFQPPSYDLEAGRAWTLPPEVLKAARRRPLLEGARRAFERSLVLGRERPRLNAHGPEGAEADLQAATLHPETGAPDGPSRD